VTTEDTNDRTYSEAAATGGDLVPAIMRLLRIFRHRKKVVFATLYCFSLAGIAYYLLATRMFESSAKLEIVEQNLNQLSATGEQVNGHNTMANQRELVTSPVVVEQAIRSLDPIHLIDLKGIAPRDWVKSVTTRLSASVKRRTDFLEVSYRSRDPEAAAAMVRALIRSYLDFVDKNHRGTAGDIIAVLTEEQSKLQQSLNQRQMELQQFRQRVGHLAISSEDGVVEPMIQRAVRLNDAMIDAQERRLELQANLAAVEGATARGEDVTQQLMSIEPDLGRQMLLASMGLSPQDLRVLGDQRKKLLATREELQSLSAHYGPNHPRIIELGLQAQTMHEYLSNYHSGAGQRLDALGSAVPGEVVIKMLRQAVRQAGQQEKQLDMSFELARTEAAKHSDSLVQLRMLERDVARKETLYDSLADKIANIDIRQVQAPIQATVVREPLPNDRPVSPRLRFVFVVCLFGGTSIGGLIAYVQDVLDDRFNSPEELSSQLGVPILAMVRKLDPIPGVGLATVHINALPNDAQTEAFRTLRTSLSLSGEVCDRILISSSEPGDGKTTIAANLAVALAQAGKRTLVIDADLRRPGFTALVDLKGQAGVADLLASDEPPTSTAPTLVHQTEVEGLDVLPAGFRRPNPAELLSGKNFAELLAWADSVYDRVIVDCPPVLAVSDAQIIGQLVDGAILVVRPEKNHRRSVIRAVESFGAAGCRVLGVVANGLSEESSGYGYGYGYSYDGGYGHASEEDSMEAVEPPSLAPPTVDFRDAPPPSPERIRPRRAA